VFPDGDFLFGRAAFPSSQRRGGAKRRGGHYGEIFRPV